MTLRSRSASTSWAFCACSGVALAFTLASGCGPPLGTLLRERHYSDAICAASFDGTGLSTRRVAKSLAQDLSAAIHLHPITSAELRSAFAGKLHQDVELLQQQFLFVRLLYSANSVPVGPFGLAVRVQTDRGLLRVIDFSRYESVLALTHERIPRPRTGVYDSTSEAWVKNFFASPFLLMANLFYTPLTGKFAYFRGKRVPVNLPLDDSDWQAASPDTYALRQVFQPAECVDTMTRPCQAFFAIERPGATAAAESQPAVQLQFSLHFGPLPILSEQDRSPACFMTLTHTVELPPGAPLAARLAARFGNQQRLFSELGARLAAAAELLRPGQP